MKKLIPIIVLFFAVSGFAQEEPKAGLVDEFGEVCSEDLMARMDNFFVQLQNNSAHRGIVIFHGRSDTEGRNSNLSRYISNLYPARRRYDSSRIKLIRGDNRVEQLIEFWLVPIGAEEPKPDRPYVVSEYRETTLFDRAWANSHRWHGGLDIYSDGFLDLGCDFSPNRGAFAKILNENSGLNAFLIVYTSRSNAARGRKIAGFALNDLVTKFRVSRSRVRAVYGGIRKEPEIEFWLVPRNQKRPSARPNLPGLRNF